MPSRGKTLTVDRATGLLRRLRIRDYDGATREIELSSFTPLEKLPDVELPKIFQSQPVDPGQIMSQWKQQQGWVVMMIGEILERREDLEKAGKVAEADAILTRWAAQYADSLHALNVRSVARRAIRAELDRGIPLADLLKDAEGGAQKFAGDFAPLKGQLRAAIEARIMELAFDIETEAIERPVDSTLHGPLRELLRRSLDPGAVDALRIKTFGDRFESLYREELDSHRGV